MLIKHLQERTDKMRLTYADYNPLTNSIDVTTFEKIPFYFKASERVFS